MVPAAPVRRLPVHGIGPHMRVAAAQARPVWFDRAATTAKVVDLIGRAAAQGVELLAFPETFLSGYPLWIRGGTGIGFEAAAQRQAYAAYLESAVDARGAEVREVCAAAADHGVFVYLGASERVATSGHGTVYCSLIAIHPRRVVGGAPQARADAPGADGVGIRRRGRPAVHDAGGLRVGGLNCWENWMPPARHALYADGEELHVATWPGWAGQTSDICRFVALEGRVAVLAPAGLLSPMTSRRTSAGRRHAGRCRSIHLRRGLGRRRPRRAVAGEPVVGEERLVIADIDPRRSAALASRPIRPGTTRARTCSRSPSTAGAGRPSPFATRREAARPVLGVCVRRHGRDRRMAVVIA